MTASIPVEGANAESALSLPSFRFHTSRVLHCEASHSTRVLTNVFLSGPRAVAPPGADVLRASRVFQDCSTHAVLYRIGIKKFCFFSPSSSSSLEAGHTMVPGTASRTRRLSSTFHYVLSSLVTLKVKSMCVDVNKFTLYLTCFRRRMMREPAESSHGARSSARRATTGARRAAFLLPLLCFLFSVALCSPGPQAPTAHGAHRCPRMHPP